MARPTKAKRASLAALKSMFAEFICRGLFGCLFVKVFLMYGRRDDVLVCCDLGAWRRSFITSCGTCLSQIWERICLTTLYAQSIKLILHTLTGSLR